MNWCWTFGPAVAFFFSKKHTSVVHVVINISLHYFVSELSSAPHFRKMCDKKTNPAAPGFDPVAGLTILIRDRYKQRANSAVLYQSVKNGDNGGPFKIKDVIHMSPSAPFPEREILPVSSGSD